MLTQAQIDQFQHDGFLNAGQVLDPAEVTELSDELNRILEIGPDGFAEGEPQPVLFRDLNQFSGDTTASAAPVWQIINAWETSPAFERLIYHPFIVRAIVQLTNFPNLQVWHDQVQYKPAEAGGATTWHQDAPLWPSISPMTPVSAWIPFDDAELDNGCMWMVPGSHRWDNQIEYLRTQDQLKDLEDFKTVGGDFEIPAGSEVKSIEPRACPVKRGEVHFHHSLTWHGSPKNTSPRHRRALAIHYMSSDSVYVVAGGHLMAKFITLEDGAPMLGAGEHFPIVARDGEPAGAPGQLRSAPGA